MSDIKLDCFLHEDSDTFIILVEDETVIPFELSFLKSIGADEEKLKEVAFLLHAEGTGIPKDDIVKVGGPAPIEEFSPCNFKGNKTEVIH